MKKKITDSERMDWIEKQSGGSPWAARQSTMGRGFRLHNTLSGEAECLGFPTAPTARKAIDAAMRKEKSK